MKQFNALANRVKSQIDQLEVLQDALRDRDIKRNKIDWLQVMKTHDHDLDKIIHRAKHLESRLTYLRINLAKLEEQVAIKQQRRKLLMSVLTDLNELRSIIFSQKTEMSELLNQLILTPAKHLIYPSPLETVITEDDEKVFNKFISKNKLCQANTTEHNFILNNIVKQLCLSQIK